MIIEIGKTYKTQCGEKVKINGMTPRFYFKSHQAKYQARTVGRYPATIFYHEDGTQSHLQSPAYKITAKA